MKLTPVYAAISDPDLNRHFSRRWTAPVEDDCHIPAPPNPKTLEDLSLELTIDWRRYPREV
jgi:hypothetical protein